MWKPGDFGQVPPVFDFRAPTLNVNFLESRLAGFFTGGWHDPPGGGHKSLERDSEQRLDTPRGGNQSPERDSKQRLHDQHGGYLSQTPLRSISEEMTIVGKFQCKPSLPHMLHLSCHR